MASTKSIRTDYLNGTPDLRPFYQYPLVDADFGPIIQQKSTESIDRKGLQAVIASQYEGLDLGEKCRLNLEKLGEEQTFTVTTGHQLVFFGGPLFTVYKVMTAIRLAESLNQRFTDRHIVPIFWIHTEDHDYEEINHYYSDFGQPNRYPGTFQSNVGAHVLTDDILSLIPAHFPEALKMAFQPGRSLATAYRHFMHELFREYGLLMLDADDPRLKATFRKVVKEELRDSAAFHAINKTSEALAKAGYPLQISPREINLFYLDAQGRDRIIAANGSFQINGRETILSSEQMHRLVEESPELFSPNVSLRPLYQEMILPNLCYIGGWGELSYWLQLKGIFDHHKVAFPLLLPRMSASLWRESEWTKWKDLGFEPADIAKNSYELYRQYMPAVWDESQFVELSEGILSQIETLEHYIHENLSETLARSGAALGTKNKRFLKSLRKKAHRVIRSKFPSDFRKIDLIKQKVQPDRMVQERILSLAAFPEFEPKAILEEVWKHCEPLSMKHVHILMKNS